MIALGEAGLLASLQTGNGRRHGRRVGHVGLVVWVQLDQLFENVRDAARDLDVFAADKGWAFESEADG